MVILTHYKCQHGIKRNFQYKCSQLRIKEKQEYVRHCATIFKDLIIYWKVASTYLQFEMTILYIVCICCVEVNFRDPALSRIENSLLLRRPSLSEILCANWQKTMRLGTAHNLISKKYIFVNFKGSLMYCTWSWFIIY